MSTYCTKSAINVSPKTMIGQQSARHHGPTGSDSHVSVDGGPPRDMVIRVSHIYRRIDGEWKLVHRHADFPPPDQRTTAAS